MKKLLHDDPKFHIIKNFLRHDEELHAEGEFVVMVKVCAFGHEDCRGLD